jgi:hypothetical protein
MHTQRNTNLTGKSGKTTQIYHQMQIVSAGELVVFAQGKALFAMIEKTHANKKNSIPNT